MPESTTTLPQSPLTKDEYNTLYNWIAAGAPDKNGNIPFSTNPTTRQKIYVTQQGCDLMAVIDAQKMVVMRYIPIGTDASAIESPHCTRLASDGSYAYVSYLAGTAIQKIDTRTDTVVSNMSVGLGSWNILYVSPGDTTLVTTDWTSNGRVVFGNATTMQTQPWLTGSGSGLFVYPHGIASTANFDTVLVTAQYGNLIYRYRNAPLSPSYKTVSINGRPPVATNNNDATSPNPHEILMTPDYNKYFLTCQGTNEIRVLNAHTNAVLDSIPVGIFPQEMAISSTKPYLFVTCQEDNANTQPGRKGSVYVINYNTHEVITKIYGDFYQPHGIAVDDINNQFYVVSTNANPSGPAPHHATSCGGRAGWYSVYDLNTLQPVNTRRYELTVMPYSAAPRFKQ
jgi:DNA-binding beta-propeller fold protein YncE